MSPSDKKPYPLVTKTAAQRVRRSISPRDYALPKPYRRKRFVEDQPGMSKRRMAVLTLSGLVITGLIAALAVLAKHNLYAPPVPIIAAPRPSEVTAPLTPAATPRAVAAAERAFRPRPVQAAPAPDAAPRPALIPARPPRLARPLPEPVAPDPDVVLITAILTLTPKAEPEMQAACTPSVVSEHGCAAIHGMEP